MNYDFDSMLIAVGERNFVQDVCGNLENNGITSRRNGHCVGATFGQSNSDSFKRSEDKVMGII